MNNLVQAFELVLSQDNNLRTQAEQYLATVSKEPEFVPSTQQQSLQLCLATYLLKYAKLLDPKDMNQNGKILTHLITSLQSKNVSNKSKTILKGVISSIVIKDQYNILYKMLIENILLRFNKNKVERNIQNYEFFGNYIHVCLLKKQKTPPKVVEKLYNELLVIVKSVVGEAKVINRELNPSQFLVRISALKSLLFPMCYIFSMTEFFTQQKDNLRLIMNQTLNEVVYYCLVEARSSDNKSFSLKTNQLDKEMFTVKSSVSNIFLNCSKILMKTTYEPFTSVYPIYKNRDTYLNQLVGGLSHLLKERKYYIGELSMNQPFDDVLNTVVELASYSEFIEYYSPRYQMILDEIVIPILALNSDIESTYQTESEEFFNFTIYLVNQGIVSDSKKNENFNEETEFTIQVKVVKMIHHLCRHIHGVTTKLVSDCLRSLEANPDNLVALLVLNSLVQKVNGRDDLLQKIKQYVVQKVGKFEENQPVRQKIIYYMNMLLGYRYLQLFTRTSKQFMTQFWNLASHILVESKDQTLQYLCLEIIILTVKLGFTTLYEQRSKTLTTLTEMISRSLVEGAVSDPVLLRVLDCLQEILDDTPEVSMIQEHIKACMSVVVRKLVMFYESTTPQQALIANGSWNVIKSVIAQSKSKTLLDSVEDIIEPLFKYILDYNIDEEEFIYCLSVFIKAASKVSKEYQVSFFRIIPLFFEKNKRRFFDLFEIINIYIQYAPDMFINDPSFIEMIITMVVQLLEADESIKEDEIVEGVILLQNVVYNFHQHLKQEHWTVIIESVLKRLGKYIKYSFLTSNLIVILDLAFISNYSRLQNTQLGQKLFSQMLKISTFIQAYPSKIHIVCFCELLKKIGSPLIRNNYIQIFDSAISLTRTAHYHNEAQKDKDQEPEFFSGELEGYHMIVERFVGSMKQLDEFEVMKKTLKEIKTSHSELFLAVVKQLPAEKVEYLKVVMQISKVKENDYRSIVKVKRAL